MTARITDVAKRAGVSSATVSRVLADKPHISDEVRERVLKAVDELNYRPNRIARSLRVQRSSVIGLVISDIQNPFFTAVVRAVEDLAYQQGYGVFLCNSDENPDKERLYLDLFYAEQVAGVILTPTQGDARAYQMLLAAGIPLTLIDREVEGLEVDTVVTNNTEASLILVRRLIAEGHERIGAVLSELSISTGLERFRGYRQALQEAGLPSEERLVRFGRPVSEDGYLLAQALLAQAEPPSALFTGSKLLTLGALRYLLEHGFHVPDDVALGAFDTLEWFPNAPAMWVAEQPAYELGANAARLLLERLASPTRAPERVVLSSNVRRVGATPVPLPLG